MSKQKKEQGFTIIELMFAMTAFSIVMMVALASIVQIGRLYYKGVTTASVQEAARRAAEEISQTIQFSALSITSPSVIGPNIAVGSPDTVFFCVGTKRYTVAIDRELSTSPSTANKEKLHVFWVDDVPACAGGAASAANLENANPSNPATPVGTNGRELLQQGMRITRLSITPIDAPSNTLWQLTLNVAYGDEDLMEVDPNNATRKICRSSYSGTEFCAFAEQTIIIKKRV